MGDAAKQSRTQACWLLATSLNSLFRHIRMSTWQAMLLVLDHVSMSLDSRPGNKTAHWQGPKAPDAQR